MARQISWGAGADGYEVGDIRPGYADSDDGRWMVANGRRLNGLLYPALAKKWFNSANAMTVTADMFSSVAADGVGTMVASPSGLVSATTPVQLKKSVDGGVTWANAGIVSFAGFGTDFFVKLQYVNGLFFAFCVSDNGVSNANITRGWAYSVDGQAWTPAPAGFSNFHAVDFGNGAYIFSPSNRSGVATDTNLYKTTDPAVAPAAVAAYTTTSADLKVCFFAAKHGLFYATLPTMATGGMMRTSADGISWSDTTIQTNSSLAAGSLGGELAVFNSSTGVMSTYFSSSIFSPTTVTFAVGSFGLGAMNKGGDWLIKGASSGVYYAYKADGSSYREFTGLSIGFQPTWFASIPGGGVLFGRPATTNGTVRAVRDPSVAVLPIVGATSMVAAGLVMQQSVNSGAPTARGFSMKVKP